MRSKTLVSVVAFLLALGLSGADALAVELAPEDAPEVQVNSYTTGAQTGPRVAAAPSGEVLVIWSNDPTETATDRTIQARRLDAEGRPLGSETQVSGEGAIEARSFGIAPSDGEFLVVWKESEIAPSSGPTVTGRRVDLDGQPIGAEFQVLQTTDQQELSSFSDQPGGGFVISWHEFVDGGARGYTAREVRARRYDATGTPATSPVTAASSSDGTVLFASSAEANTAGSFMVGWTRVTDCSGYVCSVSPRARRFDAHGAGLGDELTLAPATTEVFNELRPQAVALGDGDFATLWRDDAASPLFEGIRVPSSGDLLGSTFAFAPTRAEPAISNPRLATLNDDTVVAVYEGVDDPVDSTSTSIQMVVFDPEEGPSSGSQLVNAYTTGSQRLPEVTTLVDGSVLVVWQSAQGGFGDDGNRSIEARRLVPLQFRGDFERGDSTDWDDTVTP